MAECDGVGLDSPFGATMIGLPVRSTHCSREDTEDIRSNRRQDRPPQRNRSRADRWKSAESTGASSARSLSVGGRINWNKTQVEAARRWRVGARKAFGDTACSSHRRNFRADILSLLGDSARKCDGQAREGEMGRGDTAAARHHCRRRRKHRKRQQCPAYGSFLPHAMHVGRPTSMCQCRRCVARYHVGAASASELNGQAGAC